MAAKSAKDPRLRKRINEARKQAEEDQHAMEKWRRNGFSSSGQEG